MLVDGRVVVESRRVVGLDEAALLAAAQQEAERLWSTVQEWHPGKLTADELAPPSFPALDADLAAPATA